MRNWINLLESAQTQYYIRFGEIPANERSGIGASPNFLAHMMRKGDHEVGVSVYWGKWHEDRKQWEIVDCGNYASLDELTHSVKTRHRKIYLVTGVPAEDEENDDWALGMDGEPLIHQVKVIKELQITDIFAGGFFDGRSDDYEPEETFHTSDMFIIYPDGKSSHKQNVIITADDLQMLMGASAHINGHKGTFNGSPAMIYMDASGNSDEMAVNKFGTDIAREGFQFPDFMTLKGKVLIMIAPEHRKG